MNKTRNCFVSYHHEYDQEYLLKLRKLKTGMQIADYSLKDDIGHLTDETKQIYRFKSLQREINHILYDEILHDNCILIPTGDGMIVGIKEIEPVTYVKSIELMIRIYEWAEREKTELRGSLHTGSVNVLKDINKRENLIGNTIKNN